MLEAILDQDVDDDALGEAVLQAEQRYTSFASGLATTGHGFRYIPLASSPCAYEEVPGKRWRLGTEETNGRLYRVTYAGPWITVSLHHGLADGRGVFEYLKTLLYYYLVALGESVDPEGKVLLVGDMPASEDEYPSKKYAEPVKGAQNSGSGSAQLFGIKEDYLDERGEYPCRHVEVTAPVASVLSVAHDAHATVTPLLAVAVDRAIGQTYHPEDELLISCVTTDLRPLFGSTTVQNFSGWVMLAEVPAMRAMTIEAEAQAFGQQIAAAHNKETALVRMGERVANIERFEKTPVDELFGTEESRMVEKCGIRSRLGSLVTNVGVVDLPKDVQRHVCRASFRIPSFNATMSIAISSCGDTFTMNVTQPFASEGFSRALAETLEQMGIPASLDDRGLEAYDVLVRDAVEG